MNDSLVKPLRGKVDSSIPEIQTEKSSPRLIAYYLPQYHPIPENDEWWGRGFTEWRNTGRARRLFPGHYQPHVPADLGYYDLRVPETRESQAAMARTYGIEGFCYYHYWFGNGRQLLERPFQEVVRSGSPEFPFCLCWANESWTGVWHGLSNKTLIEQIRPDAADDEKHFQSLLPAFQDNRYICVDGKPVFAIWRPFDFVNAKETVNRWRAMAAAAGLPGIHLVGIQRPGSPSPEDQGFDASIYTGNPPLQPWVSWKNPLKLAFFKALKRLAVPRIYSYERSFEYFLPETLSGTQYPSLVHAWDNTPRSGKNGLVLHGANPPAFRRLLRRAFELTRSQQSGHRLIFLKSWNEWAEGNHLEPDLRFGHGFLKAIQDELEHELQLELSTE